MPLKTERYESKNGFADWCYHHKKPKAGEDAGVDWCLFDDNYPVVTATLVKTGAGHWETHMGPMKKRYRGKGLGIKLYKKMINYGLNRGYRVCSSTHTSPDARRVWKSARLNKEYDIVWRGKYYEVLGKK
jgi:GNAT superfamily N-acetyltransferase